MNESTPHLHVNVLLFTSRSALCGCEQQERNHCDGFSQSLCQSETKKNNLIFFKIPIIDWSHDLRVCVWPLTLGLRCIVPMESSCLSLVPMAKETVSSTLLQVSLLMPMETSLLPTGATAGYRWGGAVQGCLYSVTVKETENYKMDFI